MTRLEAVGHVSIFALLALLALLWVSLMPGCATFNKSRETCVGAVDTPKEAVRLVVPHLNAAIECAAEHIGDDPAQIACVQKQMEALKTQVTPVALACGLALMSEATGAASK